MLCIIVSLLEKIKLCMTESRGTNQIALINLINCTNKTDLKNKSRSHLNALLWDNVLKAEQTYHVHQQSPANLWLHREAYKCSNRAVAVSHSLHTAWIHTALSQMQVEHGTVLRQPPLLLCTVRFSELHAALRRLQFHVKKKIWNTDYLSINYTISLCYV